MGFLVFFQPLKMGRGGGKPVKNPFGGRGGVGAGGLGGNLAGGGALVSGGAGAQFWGFILTPFF